MIRPKVSVIQVTYNSAGFTIDCINSLMGSNPSREFIVVDNASSDGSADLIASKFPEIKLIRNNQNLGFAKGCNMGVREAQGEYLAFINPDSLDLTKSISKMAKYLDTHHDISAVVPRLLETDGSVQNNIARLPNLGNVASEYLFGHMTAWYRPSEIKKPAPVESFSGAAFMIRVEDFRAVGGFNERYFMYVEDVELGHALREAGKKIVYLPDAVLTHHGGKSTENNAPERKLMNRTMLANRVDYVRRHFNPVAALLAITAIQVGFAIMKLKYAAKRFLNRPYSS